MPSYHDLFSVAIDKYGRIVFIAPSFEQVMKHLKDNCCVSLYSVHTFCSLQEYFDYLKDNNHTDMVPQLTISQLNAGDKFCLVDERMSDEDSINYNVFVKLCNEHKISHEKYIFMNEDDYKLYGRSDDCKVTIVKDE